MKQRKCTALRKESAKTRMKIYCDNEGKYNGEGNVQRQGGKLHIYVHR